MISEVFNQDCMIGMKQYPDKFFDLAVVDPPYGIGEDGRKTKGRVNRKDGSIIKKIDKRNGRQIFVKAKEYSGGRYDDNIPEEEYFDELFRVSKHQIIWGENYYPYHFGNGRIFWDKCVSGDFSDGEIAFCSKHESTRKFVFMWSGFKQGESVTNGAKMQGNNQLWEERIHPNHKPTALYKWIYNTYLPSGGKVIDTHLGSGSNRIAADKAGNIDFTGFELDKDYYEAQEKRWKNYKMQLNLF